MNYLKTANKILQGFLDQSVPYKKQRWFTVLTLSAYVLYRILIYDFLAIMFFWGLYVLYLLVQYFTPSGLPDPDQDIFQAQSPPLDQSQQIPLKPQVPQVPSSRASYSPYSPYPAYSSPEDEDRPLLRSITQFTLWKNIMVTVITSWFFTLSYIFQIPVYWPFLFIYFVWLIGLAVHKHIRHMRKYGYSPRDFYLEKGGSRRSEHLIYV